MQALARSLGTAWLMLGALACDAGLIVEPGAPPPIDGVTGSAPPVRQASLRVPARGGNVVFLDFDGAEVSPGTCSDVARACSFIARCDAHVPAFDGDASLRAAVTARVRALFRRYDVEVVAEAPDKAPFVMCIVGGRPSDLCRESEGTAGIAPLDCDNRNDNDVVFAFSDVIGPDVDALAGTIAQEVAHAYGLGHSDEPADVMFPQLTGGVTGFLDRELGSSDSSFCPDVRRQNSHRLLLEVLGPSPRTDPVAATGPLRFVEPSPGRQASSFRVRLAGQLAASVPVELYLDPGSSAEQRIVLDGPALEAEAAMMEPGPHQLEAVAVGPGGERESARIAVEVTAR